MADYVKKLGDQRTETIKIELSEAQRAEERAKACDLLDQHEKVREELKTARAGFNQRMKELDQREKECRQRASTGIDHVPVVVQDFLTSTNEVVSVEVKTHTPVARRTATAEELQEDLFGGGEREGAALS